MSKKTKYSKDLIQVDNRFVWAVTDGVRIKFAWPRDGKSSLIVANEMIAKGW